MRLIETQKTAERWFRDQHVTPKMHEMDITMNIPRIKINSVFSEDRRE